MFSISNKMGNMNKYVFLITFIYLFITSLQKAYDNQDLKKKILFIHKYRLVVLIRLFAINKIYAYDFL